MTQDDLIHEIQAAARAKRWLNCTVQLDTPEGPVPVGIKAFGKWVQVLECRGIRDTVPEQRTWRMFDAEFRKTLAGVLRTVGIKEC